MEKLIIETTIQIQKPIAEVFENIVNPEHMQHYFIAASTGRMVENTVIEWSFPEFDEQFPVEVKQVTAPNLVSFIWDPQTVVTIELIEQKDQSTVIKVVEDGKPVTAEHLKWFGGNSEGWANFLACLKAYSEYRINLRKGAFEFLKPQ
jgi:uncharacterized protein YndB with AHSA1/START domain